jgi:CP family cyanate transporter-like MFS transporter
VRAEIGRSSVRPSRAGRRAAGAGAAGGGIGLLTAGILALAFNLRAAITGLPPIFPELHGALHLSTASQALLAAIPVLCFGAFSGIAAPLSRAFGEERVLGGALVMLTAGLLLRAAAPSVLLFPGTVVAGGSIALMNVLLPSLVKRRRPERAGLLIGLYLLSLSAGAIVASLIAVPVFQAAGGGAGSVRLTLGIWAVPALIGAAVWLPQLRFRTLPAPRGGLPGPGSVLPGPVRPGPSGPAPSGPGPSGPAPTVSASTGPALAASAAPEPAPFRPGLWRHALTWQVTAFMGLQSLSYYATLSWFPTLFRDRGLSAVHAGTLLAVMNLGNAVTALLVPVLAHRFADQRLLAVLSMTVTGVGIVGAGLGPLPAAAPFIFLLGLGQGASLGLGIFYTMARAPDPATAASLSAFAQSIGYLLASTGPLLLGFLHTATGAWTIPIWVLLGVVVLQLLTGWLAGRARTVPGQVAGPAGAPSGASGSA